MRKSRILQKIRSSLYSQNALPSLCNSSPPPGRHLVFQSKVQPPFGDFTNLNFYTKIRKYKRKIAKFFWGASPPRTPINLFGFFHGDINIFASFFLVLIDQKRTQKFYQRAPLPRPSTILSGHFHDEFHVNQKSTTPIQGQLLHKDDNRCSLYKSNLFCDANQLFYFPSVTQ